MACETNMVHSLPILHLSNYIRTVRQTVTPDIAFILMKAIEQAAPLKQNVNPQYELSNSVVVALYEVADAPFISLHMLLNHLIGRLCSKNILIDPHAGRALAWLSLQKEVKESDVSNVSNVSNDVMNGVTNPMNPKIATEA